MNEELHSTKEELSLTLQELAKANAELQSKVDQLTRSNSDLQSLIAATDIATVFLDRELRIQRFTPAAQTLFKFNTTALGRPVAELTARIDYPDIAADAVRSLAAVEPVQREIRLDERWFVARSLPGPFDEEHDAGVVLTFLDITDQKRAEQEVLRLAEASERQRRLYETVLTNTPDFVYVFSLDYRFLYANDALLEMWGCTHEDAIGKKLLEIGYEPWHAEMHEREIDQVRATKQAIRGEVPFHGTNGRRDYDYIFAPIIGADGEVEAVAGTTRDVTERKELERRQAFLFKLADTLRPLKDQIAVQSEASRLLGEVLDANRVVYFEIQGDEYVIERDYFVGVQSLVGRYPVSSFGPALLEDLLSGRTVIETDATTVKERSPEEQAAFAAIEVRGHVDVPLVKGGKFLAGMTVHVSDRREWTARDVALIEETAERTWAAVERVRAEAENARLYAQLKAADRRKDEFLATLAHELRNPLAPIRSGLEFIRMVNYAPDAVEKTSAIMERQLKHMVRLVDDLMDVSRINSGKLILQKESVTLETVVDSALESTRPLLEQMEHSLAVELPTQAVELDADLTRLAQVFSNLLNNAAKYTDKGGHILLTARLEGSHVIVSVKDTGIGIAADQLPHVFDMFSQVNSSLDKAQGGLGIGLMLVQQLVDMHGGSIEARSDGQGKGAEFIVRLPIVSATDTTQEGTEDIGANPKTIKRILVVDDNQDIAYTIAALLEFNGNHTRTAYSGEEAITAVEEFKPDVVLLDIGLPQMTGYEACSRIRQMPGGEEIMIIAQSGWGGIEDRRQSKEAGFDHHLVKPVDMKALLKLLDESDKRAVPEREIADRPVSRP